MKRIRTSILTAALLAALCLPLAAQTNTPSLGDSLSSVFSWVGNINTNYHYQRVILWDGPFYVNQVNVGNEFGGDYDFYRSNTNLVTQSGLWYSGVESRQRQAGVTGTWLSEQGGLSFGYQKCSVRAGAFLDYVHNDQPLALGSTGHKQAYEVGLQASQMLSTSSALGLFVSYQEGIKYPLFGLNLHLTFGGGNGLFGL